MSSFLSNVLTRTLAWLLGRTIWEFASQTIIGKAALFGGIALGIYTGITVPDVLWYFDIFIGVGVAIMSIWLGRLLYLIWQWARRYFAKPSGKPQATTVTVQPIEPPEIGRPKRILVDREISLAELAKDSATIRDKTFENCDFIGPGMVFFGPNCAVLDSGFDGPPNNLLLEVELDRKIIGAVGFNNCFFRSCHFRRIGVLALRHQMEMFQPCMISN